MSSPGCAIQVPGHLRLHNQTLNTHTDEPNILLGAGVGGRGGGEIAVVTEQQRPSRGLPTRRSSRKNMTMTMNAENVCKECSLHHHAERSLALLPPKKGINTVHLRRRFLCRRDSLFF